MSENVKVAIRLRPLNKCEKDENLPIQWVARENSVVSLDPDMREREDNKFHFDNVFDVDATNSTIFDIIVKPIVNAAINGINGTIFSYGQFNSGKTYTMVGAEEEPGIIFLSINYIFDIIASNTEREFLLRVSYLEIHDEKVNDLLNLNGNNLELHKDDNERVTVHCKEEVTNSLGSMLSVMKKGLKNGKIRQTNRNRPISGHNIFRITIESQEVSGNSNNIVQISQLDLIDLAGFERPHQMDAVEKDEINTSLFTLESIIVQLSKSHSDQKDIDCHKSKLTELLHSAIAGNTLAVMICTVIPVALEETYHTLLFALQVRNIKTNPHYNEDTSNKSLLNRYTKQLIKLQTELQKGKNANSSKQLENTEPKLQEKYQINYLLEERIRLLKNQIVSGCNVNFEESFKCKSRKRQPKPNSVTSKQHIPVFQPRYSLPTIKEMSPEKPRTKSMNQSNFIILRTFQTAFADFELDLIESESGSEIKENGNSIEEKDIDFTNDIPKSDSSCITPVKQDSCVQTLSYYTSPSTPKNVLRQYISDLAKDLIELREFTTLEKQLICEENHCNAFDQSKRECISSNSIDNEMDTHFADLVKQLEEDKAKLADELTIKIQEVDEIKNDVLALKSDVEKLQNTIYLLTNENMDMSTKLSVEKERSKQAEVTLQKTIDELYARISKITDEKINLESDLMTLNDRLQLISSKTAETISDEPLLVKYQEKIEKLKTENIELSAIIEEKNKELESIKESKSLLFNHECIYKEKLALLTEKHECLVAENSELSTDLMDKIEENDMLREECDVLKNKMSLMNNVNSEEDDVERLRTENNFLKAEIVELKMRVTTLSNENTTFSNNLFETIDDLDNSRSEKSLSSIVSDDITKANENTKKELQEKDHEALVNKIIELQSNVDHLTRLNKKLSDLKLSSCSRCSHLKNLNDSRRALKLEAKILNHKLEDLQRKFDRKCADTEALKIKVNQDLNLSFVDLNASFANGMDVSFVEEKVQCLNNELQVLKDDRDKLSMLYKEKCDELEKLHDEVTDEDSKSKKHTSKNECKIEKIQKDIDQVRDDIDELKKNSTNFTSMLTKFRTEKISLLEEINALKIINEELQQKVSSSEMSAATAMEKAQILENDLSNMSKEVEEFSKREKEMKSERLTLELEIEDLKVEKQNKDVQIVKLHQTIDDLNDCISSLKEELDSITSQKNELAISTESSERKHADELALLQKQYMQLEIEKKQITEAENRAIQKTHELKSDIEKLQTDLIKQENLYKEVQGKVSQLENLLRESENEKEVLKQKLQELEDQVTESKDNLIIEKTFINDNKKLKEELDTIKESMIKELASLKYKVNSMNFLNKNANEIFIIFLQTLMSKEEEVIKTMRASFERDKQKLEDEKRQSADAEKRVTIWSKELETEIEKLQGDLTKREDMYRVQQDKIYQLEHLLRECKYEKEILKEKMEALETDYHNLQAEFDKQYKVDVRQEEAIIVAQKREKELQEAFKNKEIELQLKLKSEKELYEKRIEDLLGAIETYKTKNMELRSNMEGLEANEKQLKNIIEANAIELKTNNQTIHKINVDFEQLTQAYNEVNRELEHKTSRIEEITTLLKSKCDMLSEYKTKFETIMPDYEMLRDQVKERKVSIERYKEEIEKLKMEKEEQIEIIKDKLNSEEIKNHGLNKQLNELNNKNIALVEELDTLKEKYENLQHVNTKLEKKIRNSTSKVKAEAEMEDLRDLNKRLQSNLEGASNRIAELQDSKNKILKELVNVKGQYELLSQENIELQKTLSSYKSRQNVPCYTHETILQEKNKVALELESTKILLNQRDKEIKEYISQLKDISIKNKELNSQLEEHVTIICKRDQEISCLKDKLYVHQIENKLVNELEEKLTSLKAKNKKLHDQLEAFKARTEIDTKQAENIKLHNEKVLATLRKENLELQAKLNEYENKLEVKSNSSSSRSVSPAIEVNRRRHSRNEIFNQKRHLENMMIETDVNENQETCQILRKKIQDLELQLVSKNGQIATLEIQIQSENFPYQQKCKELEELLLTYRKKNAELSSEVRKLQRAMNDINAWECDICRRWRINRRDQGCQTVSSHKEIVDGHVQLVKLEKEKTLLKDLCRSRCRRIKDLESKVKELEEAQATCVLKPIDSLQETINQRYTLMYSNQQLNLEKNVNL
ncbi:uncharacterized protein LOC143180609 [Calliopsis andreniformis]|uniref:uncharacterized protein LOC143180609 n=1 Tax=Calliopsis andreniformis TaxID=337506 RepID=UPI003FCE4147